MSTYILAKLYFPPSPMNMIYKAFPAAYTWLHYEMAS